MIAAVTGCARTEFASATRRSMAHLALLRFARTTATTMVSATGHRVFAMRDSLDLIAH